MNIHHVIVATIAVLGLATPAQASGGLMCQTAGGRPIALRLVVSHTAVPVVVSARLIDDKRDIPVALAQSWIDPGELRVDLVDRNAQRHELRLRTKQNGRFYDGSLWRGGKRHWVRCREG